MLRRMKRVFLGLMLLCAWAAAEEEARLPQAVLELSESVHPGYTIAAHDGWGDESRGQFALILKQGDDNILCIAEKTEEDAAYQMTVDNTNAVYDGDRIPSLLIDSGGDVLFYTYYDDVGGSEHYHAVKQNGKWLDVDTILYEWISGNMRSVHCGVWDGYLHYREYEEDENENILQSWDYAPIPVEPAFVDAMQLERFDIDFHDADPIYGMFNISKILDLPDSWMWEKEHLIAVDLKQESVALLFERPESARILRIATLVDGLYRLEESRYLPEDMGMDAFHAGEDELYLTRSGGLMEYGFERQADGRWRMTYMDAQERIMLPFGGVCCMEASGLKRNNDVYYGTHPWSNLMEIDFEALPCTVKEAVAMMDQSAYALVHNPNPEDRLHLREQPDKHSASLGKFYNRTPVFILERGKTWTKVRIGSEEQGFTGYMMTKFLAFDEREKAALACAFPQKHLLEHYHETGISMYSETSINGKTQQVFENNDGDFIIGVYGDEWFVVMREDGAVGYVPQEIFWDGNG